MYIVLLFISGNHQNCVSSKIWDVQNLISDLSIFSAYDHGASAYLASAHASLINCPLLMTWMFWNKYKTMHDDACKINLICYFMKRCKMLAILWNHHCWLGGLMFVNFLGYPYPRIYVSMNFEQGNELSYIVTLQTSYSQNYVPMNQQKFDNPRAFAPTNKYDFTIFNVNKTTCIHAAF